MQYKVLLGMFAQLTHGGGVVLFCAVCILFSLLTVLNFPPFSEAGLPASHYSRLASLVNDTT